MHIIQLHVNSKMHTDFLQKALITKPNNDHNGTALNAEGTNIPNSLIQANNVAQAKDAKASENKDNNPEDKEHVYVKISNKVLKLCPRNWNTIVSVGDLENLYCFVCDIKFIDTVVEHVEQLAHKNNLDNYKILEKYKDNVIRMVSYFLFFLRLAILSLR